MINGDCQRLCDGYYTEIGRRVPCYAGCMKFMEAVEQAKCLNTVIKK